MVGDDERRKVESRWKGRGKRKRENGRREERERKGKKKGRERERKNSVDVFFDQFYHSELIFDIVLPCQWKFWHRAKNRPRDNTRFGIYNPQNVKKSGFGQSVCVSVRPTVCMLSLFPRALAGVGVNRSS